MKLKLLALMTAAVLLVSGALAAWALADSDRQTRGSTSGGAPATPLIQGPGGGALAPVGEGAPAARTAQADEAPEAVLGQEPTPTVPEGEQQPSDSEAPSAGKEPAAEGDTLAEDESGPPAAQPAGAAESTGAGEAGSGSLPMSGLSLIALAAAGVGLLAAGLALRRRAVLREDVTSRRG